MSNGQPPVPPPTPPPASAVPPPFQPSPPPKKSRGRRTCLIVAGIGCLLLVLGAAGVGVAGYLAFLKADRANRDSAADEIEKTVEGMVEDMKISEAERRKILEPVRDLAARTRKDEVSASACLGSETAILRSPVPAMILAMGFESTYVERSGLTQEEKAGARVTVARYASGLASSKIPNECVFLDGSGDAHFASGSRQRIPGDRVKTAHILDMTWPYVTEDGRRRFKAAMTDTEIRQCLALMKDAADAAGIDERAEAGNLADAICEVIERCIRENEDREKAGGGGGGGRGRSRGRSWHH